MATAHTREMSTTDNNAQIWLEFFTLFQQMYASLPGFEAAFFDGERVEILLPLIAEEHEQQLPKPLEATKALRYHAFQVC